MLLPIQDDTSSIPLSPILAMAQRVTELRAQGHNIVDLTLGEPDFAPPAHVGQAAVMRAMDPLGYTPSNGISALRKSICRVAQDDHGLEYGDQQVAVGCGAKQIIFNAFFATIRPGDEVILPAPYWASYPDMVRLCGGVPVILPCAMEDGFRLAADVLAQAITARTRWVVLNAPGNPSGATYDAAQLGALADVLRQHAHVAVMSDEIYAHIRYDDRPYTSIATVAPDLQNRMLVVNGVSKAYAMTGWRVGWGLGPVPLISRINAVQGQNSTQTATLSQIAAVAALDGPQDILAKRNEIYRQRRDIAMAILSASPALNLTPPDGAFYLFPQIIGRVGDQAVAARLLKAGVATVPGSGFGAPGHLRLSFATDMDTLKEGCRRIVAALGSDA